MSWLDLPRTDEPEDIDDPTQPFDELQRSMADVALTNRLFGGTRRRFCTMSLICSKTCRRGQTFAY